MFRARKGPKITVIHRHKSSKRPRTYLRALLRISQKSSVTADAHCRQSHETNIFLRGASRGGNSFSKNTRGVWHCARVWWQSLFTERLQISTDLRNRRLNWIAKDLSSWQPFRWKHACLRTRTRDRDRRVTDPRIRHQNRSPKSLRFLARTFPHPIAVLHYRTDAIWNSISLYVFPMNNIGSVSKSCRWHIATWIIGRECVVYRKLLILMQDRRYEIDLYRRSYSTWYRFNPFTIFL